MFAMKEKKMSLKREKTIPVNSGQKVPCSFQNNPVPAYMPTRNIVQCLADEAPKPDDADKRDTYDLDKPLDHATAEMGLSEKGKVLTPMENQEKWIETYEVRINKLKPDSPDAILATGLHALKSTAAISRDLYIIFELREKIAREDTHLTEGTKYSEIPLPKTYKENQPMDFQTFKVTARNEIPLTPGQKMAQEHDSNKDQEHDSNKDQEHDSNKEQQQQIIDLYKEAGDISNTARQTNSKIQKIVSRTNLKPHHAASPDIPIPVDEHISLGRSCGPALAIIKAQPNDSEESIVFRCVNDDNGRIPKKLHPRIYEGIGSMSQEVYNSYISQTTGPASHAEVYAANKTLIYETSMDGVPFNHAGIIVKTPIRGNGTGSFFSECPHCEHILNGVADLFPYNDMVRTFDAKLQEIITPEINPKNVNLTAELLQLNDWKVENINAILNKTKNIKKIAQNYYKTHHKKEIAKPDQTLILANCIYETEDLKDLYIRLHSIMPSSPSPQEAAN